MCRQTPQCSISLAHIGAVLALAGACELGMNLDERKQLLCQYVAGNRITDTECPLALSSAITANTLLFGGRIQVVSTAAEQGLSIFRQVTCCLLSCSSSCRVQKTAEELPFCCTDRAF